MVKAMAKKLSTHRGTPSDGHALIVELEITYLRTVHGHLFVTACNTIDCLIIEHPHLQYIGTSTMHNAQEVKAISSTSVCPVKAPVLMLPAQNRRSTSISEAQFMP